MYTLNRATILGNVTRDPETRQVASGQTVCTFGVATNRSWTDPTGQKQEQTEFHNVVAWGKLAEICGQFLAKGRKLYVEGRLQTRDWEGQDGIRRFRTEIIAENVILFDRTPTGSGGEGSGYATRYTTSPAAPKSTSPSTASSMPVDGSAPAAAADGEEEIRVEEIPF
ncbi:MAG TPA: single-stranded DNA-binding protein [Patescibacteria group bacterium]|nr:single-stranded DNA-binding protein [Patescibacteria group bacterium]